MTSTSSFSAFVLLVVEDAASLESLRPAVDILASFGIGTSATVLPPVGLTTLLAAGVCAVIVGSPDAVLPAAVAGRTALPVIRVPLEDGAHRRLALLQDSHCNLPAGPADGVFATMAIGEAGAKNAALFVVALLAAGDARIRAAWIDFRTRQSDAVLRHPPLEGKA